MIVLPLIIMGSCFLPHAMVSTCTLRRWGYIFNSDTNTRDNITNAMTFFCSVASFLWVITKRVIIDIHNKIYIGGRAKPINQEEFE